MAISTPLHADRSIRARLRAPFGGALRSARSPGKRRSPIVVAVLAAVSVVVAGAGLVLVSRSSWFDVRAFDVRGTSELSRGQVVALADVAAGTSTVWLDAAAIERRLESDPWIAEATVTSSWPHTVDIAILERRPIAIAADGATRTLIAPDGTALGPADGTRELPEVGLVGVAPERVAALATGAARAIDALRPAVARRVERVLARPDGSLELRLVDGIAVRYGAPSRAQDKAVALAEVLRLTRRSAPVVWISLVAPANPAVAFAD